MVLKVLAVWFIVAIPLALIVGKFLKMASQKCLTCGNDERRKAIETEGYEYFECLNCGEREAIKIGNPRIQYPLNLEWLNGKGWC